MSNEILKLGAVLLLLAHIAAPTLAVGFRQGIWPVAAVNLLVGVGVLMVRIPRLAQDLRWADTLMLGFGAFELVACVLAVLALRGSRVAAGLSWAVLVLHLLAVLAAVYFALTFRMSRLI